MIEGKPIKTAICMPVGDYMPVLTAFDMYRMGAWNASKHIKTGIFMSGGSVIPKQRQHLATVAMADESFTHLLWLDSDIRFPPDTLERLLSHNAPIVCASYTERTTPHRPVAFSNLNDFSERVYTTPGCIGVEEIAACGFGCVLMEKKILEGMSKPWFMIGYVPSQETFVGEDIFFFTKMKMETGFPLLLDHDLTRELRHTGRHEFTNDNALDLQAKREEAQAQEENPSGDLQLIR